MWPQITVIALWFLSLGVHLAMQGRPKKGEYSVWWQAINVGISYWILNAGGFFNVLKG